MSKANASAKQRRAFINAPIQTQNSTISQQPTSTNSTTGLTLQQVISLFDRRIISLESYVKESKDDANRKITFEDEMPTENDSNSINNMTEIIEEFNSRFDLFAQEIGNLKDLILKLQSFTMEVNKTLMEERINILSDLGSNNIDDETLIVESIMESEDINANSVATSEELNKPTDSANSKKSRSRNT
jgi:hypothetical protein